ncbi:hypothetical protein C9374_007376 [Naegleria lovaniensis]|uniref:S5 DRBM domain-containing protein n=1 Tax=Naegleria lovaniensis TaxID=51637 RepID=A0AA88GGX8_NAELO|nr:uncharacterized protein C9374_007376 [Naegleria lovaniensis]KAG2379237.1 hypothetical protein C9374_007376 [Naegleria lovaniensis]
MRNIGVLRRLRASSANNKTLLSIITSQTSSILCKTSSSSFIQNRCFSSSLGLVRENVKDNKPSTEKSQDVNFPSTANDSDFVSIIEEKQKGAKFTSEMFDTLLLYLRNLPTQKRQKVIHWLATEKKEMKLVRKIKEAFIGMSLLKANMNLQLPRAVQKERIWAKYINFGMIPGSLSQPADSAYNRFKVKYLYDLSKLKGQAELDDMDEMVDDDVAIKRDIDEDDETEVQYSLEESLEEDVEENAKDIHEELAKIDDNEIFNALRIKKDYLRFHELVREKVEEDPERILPIDSFERTSEDLFQLGNPKQKRLHREKQESEDSIKALSKKLLKQEREDITAPYFFYQFDESQVAKQMENLQAITEGKPLKHDVGVQLQPIYDNFAGIEKGYFGDVDIDADWDESLYEYNGEPPVTAPLADDTQDPEVYHGQKDAITDVSFEEKVLKLSRNCKMTTGGRVESYNCLYLVGSYSGLCGVGFGAAASPAVAQAKARKAAYKNIRSIEPGACIPRSHLIEGKFGSSKIRIHPSTKEQPTANPILRKLCAYLGLKYCSVRLYGSRNILNVIPAFFKCIDQLKTLESEASMRGIMPVYVKKEFNDYMERVKAGKGLYGW